MISSRTLQPVEIVWFKRDLRIVDHRPLMEARARGPVLPLLVVEPELWRQPDMSARQYAFFAECVAELADALAELGQALIVRVGDVPVVLDELAERFRINGLWSHEETGGDWTFRRDRRVRDWCRCRGIAWHELRQDGVVRRLPSRAGWARRWDRLMAEPMTAEPSGLAPLPTSADSQRVPSATQLGLAVDEPLMRQVGGRSQATRALASFLEDRGLSYRSAMSSPVSGETACSRLSPYLAWGCVSVREVAQATSARRRELRQLQGERAARWRSSLGSFAGRLHWHCHFMQKLEDEPRLEHANLHPAYDALRQPAESDPARLAAWARGETGLPFVDACMRYLAATGWLNFRMRAMLMAVASYHLWLHWREPGLHLARQFTDYEPGIHWPQVQMQSGTTGINTVRIYNPIKQGHDQDPNGDFVRRWIPELASIGGAEVHEPWRSAHARQILDRTYPLPIIDHLAAARAARERIHGARDGGIFRATAEAIQEKHGSRRSGIPRTGKQPSRAASRSTAASKRAQLALDLGVPPTRSDVAEQ